MLEQIITVAFDWFYISRHKDNQPEATRAPSWLRIGCLAIIVGIAGLIAWLLI